MMIPARLKPGDKIGIVAPASPFDKKSFMRGLKVLAAMGFEPVVPKEIFVREGYLAGSDQQRAEAVNRYFQDKSIKGIICARGGYGSVRLLQFIDYGAIKKNPKIFVGFSDITVLLSVLHSRCGLVTFHGPMVTSLGRTTKKSQKALYSMLTEFGRVQLTAENGKVINAGSASGPVLGGNLTTLCHLTGTPFAPKMKGRLLMLEEINEPTYRIDRMLTQMRLAGCFDGIAGLMLGVFKNCGKKEHLYNIVADVFNGKNIPILTGFPVGHGRSNVAFPVGLGAALDTNKKILSFNDEQPS